MSRLNSVFAHLAANGQKAMGLFVTNGFPHPNATLDVLHAIDDAGADFIELGMPFSDPLAEGLPIQRSSARALAHGTRMPDAFSTVEAFRQRSETPLLLMGYYNPLRKYGLSNFCRDAASSGVDGLILPDVPPEESADLEEAAAAHNLDLVFLVAPNTSDARMRTIDARATGFVYAVSVSGLTGSSLSNVDGISSYLARARSNVIRNPLLVGFGIRTAEDADRLSTHTDGFIVGSALVEEIERLWESAPEKERLVLLQRFVRTLDPRSQPA